MSGGVDSSVTAARLVAAGHEVTGVFLECWRAPGCRAEEDRKDALAVALDLGIPFRVLDFKQAYKERVVDIFFADYAKGLTPNPDVWCNTEIKFGLFYDWAMKQGFEAIATGHYAQILETEQGEKVLARSVDAKKDQTYFLYRTRQDQLDHILFPIGDTAKEDIRKEAHERQIPVADKPDSQGICFIGDIDVREFLKEHLGEKPGEVLDTEGNVIGTHKGVWFYTVGQRHGFDLLPKVRTKKEEWKHVLPPLYVVDKNAQNNTITVGYGAETLENKIVLHDIFWREPALQRFQLNTLPEGETVPLNIRLRHGGQLLPAHFSWIRQADGVGQVVLDEAQRGIAAGQSVVFYDATNSLYCWGGGVIA